MAYMWRPDLDQYYWDYEHKMEVWYEDYQGRWRFIQHCYGDFEAMDWEDDGYIVTELRD